MRYRTVPINWYCSQIDAAGSRRGLSERLRPYAEFEPGPEPSYRAWAQVVINQQLAGRDVPQPRLAAREWVRSSSPPSFTPDLDPTPVDEHARQTCAALRRGFCRVGIMRIDRLVGCVHTYLWTIDNLLEHSRRKTGRGFLRRPRELG